jgi:hypothetical protein
MILVEKKFIFFDSRSKLRHNRSTISRHRIGCLVISLFHCRAWALKRFFRAFEFSNIFIFECELKIFRTCTAVAFFEFSFVFVQVFRL